MQGSNQYRKAIFYTNMPNQRSQVAQDIHSAVFQYQEHPPALQNTVIISLTQIISQFGSSTSIKQNQSTETPPPFLESYKNPIWNPPPQDYKLANKFTLPPIDKQKRDKQVDKPAARGVAPQQSRLRDRNSISNLGNNLLLKLDILAKNLKEQSNANLLMLQQMSSVLKEQSNANLLIVQEMSSVLKEFLKAL